MKAEALVPAWVEAALKDPESVTDPNKNDPMPAWAEVKTSRLVATPAQADYVLAIDVSNAAWRAAHAHAGLKTKDGRPSGHVFGALASLSSMLKKIPAGKWCLAFCCDGDGAKAARRTILPGYKERPPQEMENPVPDVEAAFGLVVGMTVKQAEREGDDALVWISQQSTKPVLVFSGDRDLWHLLSDRVKILSPNLNRYVTPEDVFEEYHVNDPRRVALAKALFGDTSDTIPAGVPRLDRKKTEPLLNAEESVDPDGFYRALARMGPDLCASRDPRDKKPRRWLTPEGLQKYDAGRETVVRNYKVVRPWVDGFGRGSIPRVTVATAHDYLRSHLAAWDIRSIDDAVPQLCGDEFATNGAGYGVGGVASV